jgi:hypothetical protein
MFNMYNPVQNLSPSPLLPKVIKMRISKTNFSHGYWCKTWSVTLRQEHRLKVFGNRVLRRIFGPKRDGVTGRWGKLHNEELCDLYPMPSILRRIFGPKRDGVTGRWGKLLNEELCDLYPMPSIVGMIMSGRMIWVGHVAQMEAKEHL